MKAINETKEQVKTELLNRIPVKNEFIGKYEAGHIFMVERRKAKNNNDTERVYLLDEIWNELPDNTTKPRKAVFVVDSAIKCMNIG